MPAPVLVGAIVALTLKFAKFLYFGKFGIYPLWRSIKEYRSRKRFKKGTATVATQSANVSLKGVGFFAAPLHALGDRHFWVRFVVHTAALLTFAPLVVKGLYAKVSRRAQGAFVTGYPCCREREKSLIGKQLDKPWKEVLSATLNWVCASWRTHQNCPCAGQLIIREPSDASAWFEVHFQGRVVMLNPSKWQEEHARYALLVKLLSVKDGSPRYIRRLEWLRRRQLREKFTWPEGILHIKPGKNNSVLIYAWERKTKRLHQASVSSRQALVVVDGESLVTGGVQSNA